MGTESKGSHAEAKRYLAVFLGLLFLTAVTVMISQLRIVAYGAVALALVVAVVKGGLVAAYFMHLVGENRIVYLVLALTLFLLLALLLLPVFSSGGKVQPGWVPGGP